MNELAEAHWTLIRRYVNIEVHPILQLDLASPIYKDLEFNNASSALHPSLEQLLPFAKEQKMVSCIIRSH